MKKYLFSFILIAASITSINAQVKIGNNPNTINANSLLELESTNKGFLPPRMALNSLSSVAPLTGTTTAGMLVFSSGGTLPDGYYYWNGTVWIALSTSGTARNNYVLVKVATDLPTPVGGIITLVAGTLYEINGSITLTNKIDLNGCNIQGEDNANDKLIYTGAGELFTGANGGNITDLVLSAPAGKIFNIDAGSTVKNLVVLNCLIVGCNTIGTIQNDLGSILFSNVIYFTNTNGVTFQNDFNIILDNVLWNNTNFNTYEKFIGSFNVIQILGGVRSVSLANTATALNISGITSLVAGSVKVVMFIGTGTYVTGSFSNFWEVEASGINTEKDDVSTGNLYISTIVNTAISVINTPTKISGTTTTANLFRVTSPSNNKLTYVGAKTRRFTVVCSLSAIATANNKSFSFFIGKNGTMLPESQQLLRCASQVDRGSVTLSCTVLLAPGDYVEVFCENNTDASDLSIESMNLLIK